MNGFESWTVDPQTKKVTAHPSATLLWPIATFDYYRGVTKKEPNEQNLMILSGFQ